MVPRFESVLPSGGLYSSLALKKGSLLGGYNPLPSGNSMEVYVKWPNLTVCYGNLWAMDENGPWFHHLASISFYRW